MAVWMKSGAYLELRLGDSQNPPETVVSATRPYGWVVRGNRLVYPLDGDQLGNSRSSILRTLEALNRATYVMKVLRLPYQISLHGRSRVVQG